MQMSYLFPHTKLHYLKTNTAERNIRSKFCAVFVDKLPTYLSRHLQLEEWQVEK